MRRIYLLPIAVLLVSFALATAASQSSTSTPSSIAFVRIGVLEKPLAERVASYVSQQYSCTVRHVPGILEPSNKPIQQLQLLKEKSDILLVALVGKLDKNTRNPPGSIVLPSHGLGVLDTTGLRARTEQPNNLEAEEVLRRRVEKETVKLVARLLGLKPCPMMKCSLCETTSLQALDSKSRSLCPPCRVKAFNILREKGVKLGIDAIRTTSSEKKK